jgi:hypothetical protein
MKITKGKNTVLSQKLAIVACIYLVNESWFKINSNEQVTIISIIILSNYVGIILLFDSTTLQCTFTYQALDLANCL